MTMTTISTTLAVGFLPLNMFIYSRYWTEDGGKVPYVNMVVTVLYLWVAVIVGFFIGRKWPRTVPYFTKVAYVVRLAKKTADHDQHNYGSKYIFIHLQGNLV